MVKWFLYLVFAVAIAFGWAKFMKSGEAEQLRLAQEIERINEEGSQEELEQIQTMKDQIENLKDSKALKGIMMAFLTAGLVGIVFVIDVLPSLAHRMTHAVYDSAEMVEDDAMHDARAKLAQGDYEGAIAAFRDAAAMDTLNRLPWVEISKIQRENLHDPAAAIATLRQAIEGQEWEMSDAAFLIFRLAEIYDEDLEDRLSAASLLQQVVDQFPETRHSANARHRLHEWGVA
jgi:TolA-binding protein